MTMKPNHFLFAYVAYQPWSQEFSYAIYWKAGEVHVQGMIHEVNNVHSLSG